MPLVKITQYFSVTTAYGWTETWYKQYDDNTPLVNIAAGDGQALMDLRQKMLAPESNIDAISVSDQSVNGDSVLQYQKRPGTCAGNCDIPHTAIYTVARSGTNTRRKAVFFRGQPDDVTMLGGKFQPDPPPAPPSLGITQFVNAGTAYMNFLKNNSFGWISNNRTAETSVDSFAVAAERCVLTVGGGWMPAADPSGKPVFFRARVTFKRKDTVLNGVFVMERLTDTTCAPIERINPFQIPGNPKGQIVRYTPVLQTFAAGSWNFQKSGRRPAGKPLLHTPGRASAKALA